MDIELIIILFIWTFNSGLVTGKYTYRIYSGSKMNFTSAKSLCVTNGELLAFIKSESDMNDLKQYFTSTGGLPDDDMYIGMKYVEGSKTFKWLDKQDVIWAAWHAYEPDCIGSDTCYQNCVGMTTSYGFRTFHCNALYYVLCGKAKTTDGTADSKTFATFLTETTTKDITETTVIARLTSTEHITGTTAIAQVTLADHLTQTTAIAQMTSTEHVTETTAIAQMTSAEHLTETTAITQMASAEHFTETTAITLMTSVEHVTETTGTTQMTSVEHVTETTGTTQMTSVEHVTETTDTTQMTTAEHLTETTASVEHATETTAVTHMTSAENLTGTSAMKQMTSTEQLTEITAIAKMTSAEHFTETTALAQTTQPAANNDVNCLCPKDMLGSKWLSMYEMNLTLPELRNIIEEDFMKKIKDNIAVDKGSLSKYVRSKTSAPDDRKSSASFGWLSVALICIPVVFFVSIDLLNVFFSESKKGKRLRSTKRNNNLTTC